MPLEDTDVIDIVLNPNADGKVELVIMDAGVTTDPRRRTKLFQDKVRGYFVAVVNGHFTERFPHLKTPDFCVKAVCAHAPTPEMYEFHTLHSKSRPEHHMEVRFVQFNDEPWPGQKFRLTDKPEIIPPPSRELQKFAKEAMEFAFETLRKGCFHPTAMSLENGQTTMSCLLVTSEQIVPCARRLAAQASRHVSHFICVYDAFITSPDGEKHDALLARASERGRARGVKFALKYLPRSQWKKARKVGQLYVIDECDNDLETGSHVNPAD